MRFPGATHRVVGFEHKSDALRFQLDLAARLAKFELELHPEKTRLIRFGRFALERQSERGLGKPATFDFMGLTHICARSMKGRFLLTRHTNAKRMRAKLKSIRQELMRRRHLSIPEQGAWIHQVMRGYFAYHSVPTNSLSMCRFRTEVRKAWLFALRRRSQRHRMTWTRMRHLERRWLPAVRVLHPWPDERLRVKTQGRSPVR